MTLISKHFMAELEHLLTNQLGYSLDQDMLNEASISITRFVIAKEMSKHFKDTT